MNNLSVSNQKMTGNELFQTTDLFFLETKAIKILEV